MEMVTMAQIYWWMLVVAEWWFHTDILVGIPMNHDIYSIHIYIYMSLSIYVCIYLYIYIYVYNAVWEI